MLKKKRSVLVVLQIVATFAFCGLIVRKAINLSGQEQSAIPFFVAATILAYIAVRDAARLIGNIQS